MSTTDLHVLKVGFRFDRRDASLLQRLARQAEIRERPAEDALAFRLAAEAALTGEPLIVHCADLPHARLVAATYVRVGVRPPSLEQLS